MLDVRNLTKRYGPHLALDDLTFHVERGEVVGFLGPNGAGKTTTIRILTCFIPASSGSVRVGGCDVLRDSREVRRQIGYLPENVPLYTEMRVEEYLRFRARLKRVERKELSRAIEESLEHCRIADVRRKVIGTLSKGYRQRVGLAETLLGKPALLILDEPTSGLDPNQRREVRKLLQELGEQHTVFLSSHILSEVESVAGRVIIIDRGRIRLDENLAALEESFSRSARILAELKAPEEEALRELKEIEGVVAVSVQTGQLDDGALLLAIRTEEGLDVREDIYRCAVRNGWTLRELRRESGSLEDLFARVTLTQEEGAA